jgi:transglutaminase-like putative cysteine protease
VRKIPLTVALLFIGFSVFARPVEKDTNIAISYAKDEYSFVFNKKQNRVEVKETQTIKYVTNNSRAVIQIGETYSDNVTIDDVSIRVDGSKAKYIQPKYEYLSQDDIFFSDQHICYFNLPLDKKGSTGEVVFEKTITDPRYFAQVFFDEPYNVRFKEIKIILPRWMKVVFKEYNFKGYGITTNVTYDSKNDADIYTYTITNLNAFPRESHSPGTTYFHPHLLALIQSAEPQGQKITYFSTLADQYAWYRELVKGIENDKNILKDKALEITKDAKTELDKIKTVFYWVQNNIRYLAFEDGIAGFRPDKAHEVLRKKYGDCKGMAHLTKELLVSLGFDARLCWIGTNHIAYDYSTPSLSVDNHMICALVFQGKNYFLDATEKYIGFNEYAERIQGRQVLFEDGEKYILTHVPVTSYLQNKDFEKRILTIEGTSLKGTVEQEWHGEDKESLLSQLYSVKKENVKEAFKRFLTSNNMDYDITNLTTSDLIDFDKNTWAKYTLNHKNALSAFGKELYLDIDYRKDFGNFIFDAAERKNDYWMYFKYNIYQETQIALPTGAKVTSQPQDLLIKNDDYEINISFSQQPNKLIYKKNIIIKNPRIPASKFEQWNKDFKKLKELYAEQVVITTL